MILIEGRKVRVLLALLVITHYGSCSTKPNIIVIIVDDLGWNDVSFHGSKQIPTPNIDALAKDGIILNNYYVSPMCTPSRGALMTGKHPIRLGLQHEVILADAPWGLSLREKIFPQYLNELGYESHGVGKWHLGFHKERYLPTKRGFKSFYGYWTGVSDYYTHFSNMPNMTGLDLHDDLENDWDYNGTYGTDLFTWKAKNVIESHDRRKPLFLYLAQQAVHSGNFVDPLQAPAHYISPFAYIEDSKRRIYAGMVSALDTCIGEIFSSLKKARMLDNTIIAFTTDNGGAIQGADGNAGSNFPLRGSKYNMWEGGVRAVSFLWSARLRSRSRISNHLMHITDWLPTLYAAAGGDADQLHDIDGYNLWPSFLNDDPSPRQEVLLNIDSLWNVEGIRKHSYKLIKGSAYEGRFDSWYDKDGREIIDKAENGDDDDDEYYDFDDDEQSAVNLELHKKYRKSYRSFLRKSKVAQILLRKYQRVPRLAGQCDAECEKKLVVKCGEKPKEAKSKCLPLEAPCLFDTENDPCEYYNIAQQLPEVVDELEALLTEYKAKAISPRNKPSDPNADPRHHGNSWVPWK